MLELLTNIQGIIQSLSEKDKEIFLNILNKIENEYMITNRYPPLTNTYAT